MDRARFDALARLLATRESRRTAIGAVLGAAVLGRSVDVSGKRSRKRRGGRDARKTRSQAVPVNCFTGSPCIPGPLANLASCDFSGGSALAGLNLKSVNLSKANLEDADVSHANLSSVNLGGACLVDADLTGAVTKSTNFTGSIRCRTTMPNGTIDNSGCNKGTRCCPTCIEEGDSCGSGIGGSCCDGTTCCNGKCLTGCCPATCESLDLACGPAEDGCGGELVCGPCSGAGLTCNHENTCIACASFCTGEACTLCITLADGTTRCSGGTGLNCTVCETAADCPDPEQAVCYTQYVNSGTGRVSTASESCGNSGQLTACAYPSPCVPV